jgi:hypothetical protein
MIGRVLDVIVRPRHLASQEALTLECTRRETTSISVLNVNEVYK